MISDEEDEELLSQSHAHLENVLFYTKNQTDIIVLSSGPPKVQMTFQRLRDYLIHKVQKNVFAFSFCSLIRSV